MNPCIRTYSLSLLPMADQFGHIVPSIAQHSLLLVVNYAIQDVKYHSLKSLTKTDMMEVESLCLGNGSLNRIMVCAIRENLKETLEKEFVIWILNKL